MFEFGENQVIKNITTEEKLKKMIANSSDEYDCFKKQKNVFTVGDIQLEFDDIEQIHQEFYSDNLGLKHSFNVILKLCEYR